MRGGANGRSTEDKIETSYAGHTKVVEKQEEGRGIQKRGGVTRKTGGGQKPRGQREVSLVHKSYQLGQMKR